MRIYSGNSKQGLLSVPGPAKNHSTTQGRIGSLKLKSNPSSSVDLYDDSGKLLQRKFYDNEGKAMLDIDFAHSNGNGSHTFPHPHTWDWSSGKPNRM